MMISRAKAACAGFRGDVHINLRITQRTPKHPKELTRGNQRAAQPLRQVYNYLSVIIFNRFPFASFFGVIGGVLVSPSVLARRAAP
jgi:hypothetical protein